MRLPSKGVATVALALIAAAIGGSALSRSLHHSDAAPTPKLATEQSVVALLNKQRAAHGLAPFRTT